MGEEAYEEVVLAADTGTVTVRGGYGRDEVWLGIAKGNKPDDHPDINIALTPRQQRETVTAIVDLAAGTCRECGVVLLNEERNEGDGENRMCYLCMSQRDRKETWAPFPVRFRVDSSPGDSHARLHIWLGGAKVGELCVRAEEWTFLDGVVHHLREIGGRESGAATMTDLQGLDPHEQ